MTEAEPAVGRRLQGRRFVITGAASGIGRCTAELFISHGAQAALMDMDLPGLEESNRRFGGHVVEVDVRDQASVSAAMAKAADLMGGIDGVVNCAGIVKIVSVEDTSPEIWAEHINTNLTGSFRICQSALQWLRQADHATILNIASGQALLPSARSVAYATSKGGVVAMTKALAWELAPKIRVNAICPGMVDTEMQVKLGRRPDDNSYRDRYALRRMALPVEIANTILFLSCPESSFITGSIVVPDGGRIFH